MYIYIYVFVRTYMDGYRVIRLRICTGKATQSETGGGRRGKKWTKKQNWRNYSKS